MSSPTDESVIADIITEFAQVFAFARTRWAGYAEQVHPDLKGLSMMMLQTIKRRDAVTATELAQILHTDKAVVSRQVAKLRELGFIEATADEADRRVLRLTVTPVAEQALERMRESSSAAYHERFAGWNSEELGQLRVLLHRFNSAS